MQPVFRKVFEALNERAAVDELRCFDRTLLVALDGIWFHNSEAVHCEHGRTTYYHSAVTPVIVSPGNSRVISLEPQFIEPQDRATKQDCENAAGKRWLRGAGLSYVEHGVTILGDDLYCNQLMCELLLEHDYNFILTCKYTSHKYLAEWIEQADAKLDLNEHVEKRWDGKKRTTWRYRFANGVPIRDGEDALTQYMLFESWDALMLFMLEGLDLEDPGG